VSENLLNNVCKYALTGTRVYLDMHYEMLEDKEKVIFSIKNISSKELNIDVSELAERFIRGDESRTTEGSGLGLSIAKNLTTAQGGTFEIKLDGDLFKVVITFDACK
jgi:signal transduction histidine kinase